MCRSEIRTVIRFHQTLMRVQNRKREVETFVLIIVFFFRAGAPCAPEASMLWHQRNTAFGMGGAGRLLSLVMLLTSVQSSFHSVSVLRRGE
jgi:hypothetical protein